MEGKSVPQVEVAVIGTGWCGGIRADMLSRSSIVDKSRK
jgi:myo-inositol 2-dehydrogenase/D-chiro-inositol 1-dehydrogenase